MPTPKTPRSREQLLGVFTALFAAITAGFTYLQKTQEELPSSTPSATSHIFAAGRAHFKDPIDYIAIQQVHVPNFPEKATVQLTMQCSDGNGLNPASKGGAGPFYHVFYRRRHDEQGFEIFAVNIDHANKTLNTKSDKEPPNAVDWAVIVPSKN